MSFRLRNNGSIYLAASAEDETGPLKKAGFKKTDVLGRWRNNSSQIQKFNIWKLEAEAGDVINIPVIPADYSVFINKQ